MSKQMLQCSIIFFVKHKLRIVFGCMAVVFHDLGSLIVIQVFGNAVFCFLGKERDTLLTPKLSSYLDRRLLLRRQGGGKMFLFAMRMRQPRAFS